MRIPTPTAARLMRLSRFAALPLILVATETHSPNETAAETKTLVQTGGSDDELPDDVPAAALLTDRGTALVERLKQLRRTESRMGPKHPSLPEVQQQIADIHQQLKAWQPAPNPFRQSAPGEAPPAAGKPILLMNEEDLRQVVLSLMAEVAELRQRVEQLEQKLTEERR